MREMKKLVDTLGAVLTAICLCMMPAFADSLGGGVLVVGFGVIVLIAAVIAVAGSLLIRAIQKRRGDKTDRKK